jgi:hypothetical protein
MSIPRTLALSGRQAGQGRRSSEFAAACPLEGLVRFFEKDLANSITSREIQFEAICIGVHPPNSA